jgi:hypothetical protein
LSCPGVRLSAVQVLGVQYELVGFGPVWPPAASRGRLFVLRARRGPYLPADRSGAWAAFLLGRLRSEVDESSVLSRV